MLVSWVGVIVGVQVDINKVGSRVDVWMGDEEGLALVCRFGCGVESGEDGEVGGAVGEIVGAVLSNIVGNVVAALLGSRVGA